jgi:hypothetical protein
VKGIEPGLNRVNGALICDACLNGEGGICTTPGCIFIWRTAPDIEIQRAIQECGGTIEPVEEG